MMKSLLEWLKECRMLLRCMPHMVVTAWRQTMGRWYYFRDRPDWFVHAMAQLETALKEDDEPDAQVVAYIGEACAERDRRINQALRSKP